MRCLISGQNVTGGNFDNQMGDDNKKDGENKKNKKKREGVTRQIKGGNAGISLSVAVTRNKRKINEIT